MNPIYIILICFGVLISVLAITLLVCFFMVFYNSSRSKRRGLGVNADIPGKEYDPYRARMRQWRREVLEMPYEEVSIISHDGLTLRGRFYEYEKGAPIELMLHGYRGTSERDISGGVFRAGAHSRSVLAPDHRGAGRSDGHVITFGVKEMLDALDWLKYINERFGEDTPVLITGVSMGASTAMLCADKPLSPNVVGIIADCGYTSAEEIIKKVIRDMRLPVRLLYPFVKLSARLFGGFDIDKADAREALKNAKVPVFFIHGDADDFVPSYMSEENYRVCTSDKELVITKGAAHGLCYVVDPEGYLDAVGKFFLPKIEEKKRLSHLGIIENKIGEA